MEVGERGLAVTRWMCGARRSSLRSDAGTAKRHFGWKSSTTIGRSEKRKTGSRRLALRRLVVRVPVPDPIPTPEEFAETVFKLAGSLHGNPRVIANGIRARDAAVRAEAIEECAKAVESINTDDNAFWSKNYEIGGSDFAPGAYRDAIIDAIRALPISPPRAP